MKKLIIWDIDGTLMECRGVGRLALNLTLQEIYGIEEGFKTINFAGTIDRQIIDEAQKLHQLYPFDEAAFWNRYKDVLRVEIKKNPQIKMIEGVQSLLETLSAEPDLYHVISTGNAEVGAWVKLEETYLSAYFKHGVYGDQAENRTALVSRAIEKGRAQFDHWFLENEIFVVGDTPLDIEAAKNNGVHSIAVATGRYTVEMLTNYQPEYVFPNFMDQQAVLKAFSLIVTQGIMSSE